MSNALREDATAHHLGAGHGFGPVANSEDVLLAIFETTPRDGQRLNGKTFRAAQLKKCNESVARRLYTPQDVFVAKVVHPAASTKGALVGISEANVRKIRALEVSLPESNAKVQAIAVYDRVEDGDFDGHASLGFSRAVAELNIRPEKLGALRTQIMLELAELFSEAKSLHDISWPP